MRKDYYIYPAILVFADDGISIEFPDLPGCLPSAHTVDDAVKNAKEAMALHLYNMEIDNEAIPNPTNIKDIKIKEGQSVLLVDTYMPLYRDAINSKAVKKTLTIPKWLSDAAEKEQINFSHVLQNALKTRLNLKERKLNRDIEMKIKKITLTIRELQLIQDKFKYQRQISKKEMELEKESVFEMIFNCDWSYSIFVSDINNKYITMKDSRDMSDLRLNIIFKFLNNKIKLPKK